VQKRLARHGEAMEVLPALLYGLILAGVIGLNLSGVTR
jgi:hypothetical protein